jgi:hypothetical protein
MPRALAATTPSDCRAAPRTARRNTARKPRVDSRAGQLIARAVTQVPRTLLPLPYVKNLPKAVFPVLDGSSCVGLPRVPS